MLTLTTKAKTGKVLRRNGRIYRNRICIECGKKHFHAEKMCIKCRNTQQEKRRNKPYIKRKDTVYFSEKEQRILAHEKRIAAEMTAIRKAGMCPIKDSVQAILDAGIALDEIINYSAFGKATG